MFKQRHEGEFSIDNSAPIFQKWTAEERRVTASLRGQRVGVNVNFSEHWEKSGGHQRFFLGNLMRKH